MCWCLRHSSAQVRHASAQTRQISDANCEPALISSDDVRQSTAQSRSRSIQRAKAVTSSSRKQALAQWVHSLAQ
jgi:hypothetical protein